MWTNEEFCFDYEIENKLNKYLIIKGTTYFGENMDDEWFIVFLLYELSKKFNDITVQLIILNYRLHVMIQMVIFY